jgi:Flp pilus assembly protein TadD
MQKRLTEQGLRFLEEGQFEKAGHILSLLIAHFPENAEAHHMLGIIELEKGNYEQAYVLVNTAIDIDPNNSIFYNTLGNIELHRHKIANAELAFKNAVKHNPEKIEYQYNLANFYLSQNQFSNAIDHFYSILQTNPTHYLSIRGITVCYLSSGELDIALEHANQWVEEYSDYDEPYYYLGICLFALNDLTGALAAYDKGLSIAPTNHEIMSSIGACYRNLGNIQIAENYIHNALALEPRNPLALYHLGCIHLDNGNLESAQKIFTNAKNLDNSYAEPLCGLGSIEIIRGNESKALELFSAAQKLDQFNSVPQQLYATTLLWQQNFNQGWENYKRTLTVPAAIKQIPAWHGDKLGTNEILLIWISKENADLSQQIMFYSMLPEVINLAPNVVMLSDPLLIPLMQRSFPKIKFCSSLQLHILELEKIKYQISIGALGSLFRNHAQDYLLTKSTAYLQADPERVKYFKNKYRRLFANKKLIGISWKAARVNNSIEYSKSTQLHAWHNLINDSNAVFIAVQLGDCLNELKLSNEQLSNHIYLDPELSYQSSFNLDEIAAQLVALDLIITVDNVVAHLGGALGLDLILLPSIQNGWYWFKSQQEALWYKNVKILPSNITLDAAFAHLTKYLVSI